METPNANVHDIMSTPFFPLSPIGYTACNFLRKTQSETDTPLLTSTLMAKFGASKKENRQSSIERSNTQDAKQKGVTYFLANNPTTQTTLLDFISTTRTVAVLEALGANKNTSTITLERLANHHNPLVRAAVAENPHTPYEVLSQLCKDENADIRFAMAENPSVPKSLLSELINDDNPYVSSRAHTTLERLKDHPTQLKWYQ